MDRTVGIGATDVPAIMKLYFEGEEYHTFSTPVEVWQDKLGLSEACKPNDSMELGLILESYVAKKYAEKTGYKVEMPATQIPLTHPKYPFIRPHIDRWVLNEQLRFLLECKTGGWWVMKDYGEEGTDDMPVPYKMQCATERMCAGVPCVDLALLVDSKMRYFRYETDAELEEKIEFACCKFKEQYLDTRKQPPALTDGDIKKLRFHDNGQSIEAVPTVLELCQKIKFLKETIKKYSEEEKRYSVLVKDFMKNNSMLLDSAGKVLATYKESKQVEAVDKKKLAADFPDVYEQVKKLNNAARPLLIK